MHGGVIQYVTMPGRRACTSSRTTMALIPTHLPHSTLLSRSYYLMPKAVATAIRSTCHTSTCHTSALSRFATLPLQYLLSIANSGHNTNTAHFSITCAPAHHLDGSYVIFGECVTGGCGRVWVDALYVIFGECVTRGWTWVWMARMSSLGSVSHVGGWGWGWVVCHL